MSGGFWVGDRGKRGGKVRLPGGRLIHEAWTEKGPINERGKMRGKGGVFMVLSCRRHHLRWYADFEVKRLGIVKPRREPVTCPACKKEAARIAKRKAL